MTRKRIAFQAGKVREFPEGTPFVAHTVELLTSAAWRARNIHVARLLDRLEVEHCAHAGRENGHLVVRYADFVKFGLGGRFIFDAIERAVQLGLLRVEQRGLYRGDGRGNPSHYRLSYLKARIVPGDGAPSYYVEPSHEWRQFVRIAARRKSHRMVTTGASNHYTRGALKRPIA
jgi:hypothetical protein